MGVRLEKFPVVGRFFRGSDRTVRVVTVDTFLSRHPDEIDRFSDPLMRIERFKGRRARYIDQWNEYVNSDDDRDRFYNAWKEAEHTYNERVAKGRKDAEAWRVEREYRHGQLMAYDMRWATLQPTNYYRVAFFAYDHMRGLQPTQERTALFEALVSRRPREKQEITLQEVEKIYETLVNPRASEEEYWNRERRREERGRAKQNIRQARPARPAATAGRDVFVESRAVDPLLHYPGWEEYQSDRKKHVASPRSSDEEWASAKDEDRVVFFAVENLQDNPQVREELFIKFARRTRESGFAAMLEFQGISYRFASIKARKLGQARELDYREIVNAQAEEAWYKRFPRPAAPAPAPALDWRSLSRSEEEQRRGGTRASPTAWVSQNASARREQERKTRFVDTPMQPISLGSSRGITTVHTQEEFVRNLEGSEEAKGLSLRGVWYRISPLTRLGEAELKSVYGEQRETKGPYRDWYKMELNPSQTLYFRKEGGIFSVHIDKLPLSRR